MQFQAAPLNTSEHCCIHSLLLVCIWATARGVCWVSGLPPSRVTIQREGNNTAKGAWAPGRLRQMGCRIEAQRPSSSRYDAAATSWRTMQA